LPLADAKRREEAERKIKGAVWWYRGLLYAKPRQLSAEQIRQRLTAGSELARDLANWITEQPLTIRDYVLSAIGSKPLVGNKTLPHHQWKDVQELCGVLADRIVASLKLVRSNLGKPGNAELNDLVWTLAGIWEEFTSLPFSRTKKKPAPYDFVRIVVKAAASDIPDKVLDRQLITAMRSAVSRLQKRRAAEISRRY
jgi:hypothetical protein